MMIMMTENLATKITMTNMMMKACINQGDINKLLNEQYHEVQYAID